MFSFITKNCAAVPLVSHQVVLDLIAATTTEAGLTVHAELDPGAYPTGAACTDEQINSVPILRADFQPQWNYTIYPSQQAKQAKSG